MQKRLSLHKYAKTAQWMLFLLLAIKNKDLCAHIPPNPTASSVTITTPSVVGQSVTSAPVRYGQYIVLQNLVSGRTYQIETCNLSTDDIQLYLIYNSSSLAYHESDDACGLQSKFLFTPEVSNNYKCAPYKYYNDTSTGATPIKVTLLNNSAPLTASISTSKPCFSEHNVWMSAQPQGGTPPYTYSWGNGARTKYLITFFSNDYEVTIIDAANNTATATITKPEIYKNTVTQTAGQLTADQVGASYTWLDCNNGNQPIVGANSQSFTPSTSGNYAVRVSLNGCVDTSNCFNMMITGISNKSSVKNYQISPNPAGSFIHIISPEQINMLSIFDITGKEILNIQYNTEKVDLSNLVNGTYFLKLNFKDGTSSIEKIIKNK